MKHQQTFKAIYFPDYKIDNPNLRGLVLAFGKKEKDVYKKIASYTSHEVRELLQSHSYKELEKMAHRKGTTLNSYCMQKIKQNLSTTTISEKDSLNPIYATFRGGCSNPLHKWYSYLEGYSPEFVEYILDNFSSNSACVYDPFAGTGVTALVAAQRGLKAYYSEVNPLLQSLIKTKIDVSLLTERNRKLVLKNLNSIRENIENLLKKTQRDNSLLWSYKNSFGNSQFFDENTLDFVLRARTLVDEISYSHQLTSDILQVAILNSLIPSSLLQRAGDVRYKTDKEKAKRPDFVQQTTDNLQNIIDDIENLETLPSRPVLITEGAQWVGKLPYSKIDTIITSPPYLNGTNYFRNTKVELWFLRSIKNKDDLSEFRYESVTAGINDVTQKKQTILESKNITHIVNQLRKNAYDPRIPKMVADYFSDMKSIFGKLVNHLSDNALVAVDIGDSAYAGVKVPTDTLLLEVLNELGYEEQKRITLRKRMSRSGELLKQVLLILQAPKRKKGKLKRTRTKGESTWREFKQKLPHTTYPYTKRNWGHPLHSLCSYQGKMKPSLAHFLVKTFTTPGQQLLDPFAGVGTIPFEAALNGVKSYSFEISPAAIHIAKAKLEKTDRSAVEKTVNRLEQYIKTKDVDKKELENAQNFGFNKKLKEYYDPETLEEIVKAREFFKKFPTTTPSKSFVIANLLHILHGNRPYALSRRSHSITPFAPTGDYEYRALIPRLREKIKRSYKTEIPDSFICGEVIYQDATSWWAKNIKDLDVIITSPPFFDSTRFYLANWLRLWFSGWNNQDFKSKPMGFVDEKQKKGFEIYEPILRQARERLKPGGIIVFHLGKNNKCNMLEKLAEIAAPWFNVMDTFEESVKGKESFGIKAQGTTVKHQFLVLS